MILSFHPCLMADRQIILGSRRTLDSEDRSLVDQADAILLPLTCSEALYQACRKSGARLFPSYERRYAYPGKAGQIRLFREHGLPHPETRIWPSVGSLQEALGHGAALPHAVPFLLKTDMDHEGMGIQVIRCEEDLGPALTALERRQGREGGKILSQALVHTEGNALRGVIVGRDIRTYWKRAPGADGWLATVSGGAAIDVAWRKDLQAKGRRVVERFLDELGINVAAVDMVFPMDRPNPAPLVLEINYFFGRRGLGGSEAFYRILFRGVQAWLQEEGLDPGRVRLA